MHQIDLISFLNNYYGINNESLKMNKLTHTDVKILFPMIKRSSFSELQNNMSLVYKGELLLVYDSYGKILPYINPHLEVLDNNEYFNNYEDVTFININDIDLDKLTKDELLQLRRRLKYNHQKEEEKEVVDIIRKKKDHQTICYKKKKMLLRMEEL